MIDDTDLLIIKSLRSNSRLTVQEIADSIQLDARDCRKRLGDISKSRVCKRFCSIIDPGKIDFHITEGIFLAAGELDPLADWLVRQPNVNSLQLLHGEFDFYIEAMFRDMRDVSQFYEELGNFSLLRLREYQLLEPDKEKLLGHDSD